MEWKALGAGPTVVVLHGGPGLSHHYLLPQFGVLADQSVHESLGDYDLRPRLAEINCPALVLHGTEDPIPFRYAEELARLLPNARLVRLDGCGHVPYIECPEPFFAALRAFLDDNM